MKRAHGIRSLAVLALLAGGALVAHHGLESSAPTTAPAPAAGVASPASSPDTDRWKTADKLLGTLPTKELAPMTGYDREQFGPAWADVDHNGCDTRNDILARDLAHRTTQAGTHSCVILTGTLDDPYTGRPIAFKRGRSTSTAIQIDHVVALGDAWQTGAQQLSAARREALANDPAELLAADGPANEAKRDGDAAAWLPPNKSFRCTYVSIQVEVKAKYDLWVTQAERAAIKRVLSSCT